MRRLAEAELSELGASNSGLQDLDGLHKKEPNRCHKQTEEKYKKVFPLADLLLKI